MWVHTSTSTGSEGEMEEGGGGWCGCTPTPTPGSKEDGREGKERAKKGQRGRVWACRWQERETVQEGQGQGGDSKTVRMGGWQGSELMKTKARAWE